MTGDVGAFDGRNGAARAVSGPAGRGGSGPDRWPPGIAAGAVSRAAWDALCAASGPLTARDVANAVGTRRESANRALGQLERAGWAQRESGDAKAGVPDLWSLTKQARDTWHTGSDLHTTADVRADQRPAAVEPEVAKVALLSVTARRARMRVAAPVPPAAPGVRGDLASPPRFAAGELEEHVLEVLLARPEEQFSPLQLARILGGRSQGAVSNACKRLVEKGEAACTCPAPLRFTAVMTRAAEYL